jgi:hypothetical protein
MLWLALSFVACDEDTGTSWERYNADGDAVTISVGSADSLPAVSTILHSTSGEVEVGEASVDPGGGPIGTLHTVLVTLGTDYAADVDRVSVRTDSGARDVDEYDLDPDSTGIGIFKAELRSVGDDGETREDTLTFHLWVDAGGTDSAE